MSGDHSLTNSTLLEPWLRAKEQFLGNIEDETQKILFDEATVENYFRDVNNTDREDGTSSKVRLFNAKLEPLVAAIGDFGDALDVFTSAAPLYLSPVWGSIRVVLVMARKHHKFYQRIVETLGRIGDILPRFRDYQRIFEPLKHPRLMTALSNSYREILLFCIRIQSLLKAQRQSKLTRLFQPLSPALNIDLEAGVTRFRDLRKGVEKEAETSHMIEEARARDLVKKKEKAELRQKLLSWLSTLNYEGKQRKLRALRHQNTGEWLLASSEYKSWLNSSHSSILCCYGIPGCGKSVLASSIVDQFPIITKQLPKTAAIYHYCDYADKRTLDPLNILGSLTRALLYSIEIPSNIEDLIIKSYEDGTRSPEIDEVLKILQNTLKAYEHVILIVDGLDEMLEEDGTLFRNNLWSILNDHAGIMRLFISCREDIETSPSIRASISKYKIQVQAATISADVAGYVSDSVNTLLATNALVVRNQSLKEEITKALVEGAKGMFLWVKFVLDELCNAETDDEIRKMLRYLPQNLSEVYDRLLGRILVETRRNLVKKMFQWIAVARRPLLVTELQEGIAFHLDDKQWNPDKVPTDMTRLIRTCSNLVLVDQDSGTLEFAHYTVLQYLQKPDNGAGFSFHFNTKDANNFVGEVCVAYLCFSDFETQITRHIDTNIAVQMTAMENLAMKKSLSTTMAMAMKIRHPLHSQKTSRPKIDYAKYITQPKAPSTKLTEKYCLLNYATGNWLWHSKQFVEVDINPSPSNLEALMMSLESGKYGDPRRHSLFQNLVLHKRLLFDIRPWDSCQGHKKYPGLFLFGYALSMDHLSLLGLLIKHSDISPVKYVELTVAMVLNGESSALSNVTQEVLDFIKKTPETDDGAFGWLYSQFIIASQLGYLNVLRFCIDSFPKNDYLIYIRNHLLIEAAAAGQKSAVELLYSDDDSQSRFTCAYEDISLNAIERAALSGNSNIVTYLKQKNHQSLKLDIGMAIIDAVEKGHTKSLQALLELLDFRWFSTYETEGRGVIEHSAFISQLRNLNQAMIKAACRNDLTTVMLLLQNGVNPHSPEFPSDSPLLVAVKQNQFEMAHTMLKHRKCEVDDNGLSGSPILWAAATGKIGMVEMLLDQGNITPMRSPPRWPTALFAASANGHSSVVQFLLQRGVQMHVGCLSRDELSVNARSSTIIDNDKIFHGNGKHFTPLYAALFNGHLAITAMLLQKFASIDPLFQNGIVQSGICFWDSLEDVRSLITMVNEQKSTVGHLGQEWITSINHDENLQFIYQRLLYAAAQRGSEVGLQNLVLAGVAVAPEKARPLLCAISSGYVECYKVLRDAGTQIANDHIIAATIHGRHEILIDLLVNGADVNSRAARAQMRAESQFPRDVPILSIACILGDVEAVRILLEAGADIDALDGDGRTALIHSISENRVDVFRALSDYAPSFIPRDIKGDAKWYIVELKRRDFLQFMVSKTLDANRRPKIGESVPFTYKDVLEIGSFYKSTWGVDS